MYFVFIAVISENHDYRHRSAYVVVNDNKITRHLLPSQTVQYILLKYEARTLQVQT